MDGISRFTFQSIQKVDPNKILYKREEAAFLLISLKN